METAIDGFQGARGQLKDRDRVLATAKHYAGDGDTQYGTGNGDYTIDQGITVTNRRDFWDLAPPVPPRRAEAPRRQRDAVVLERRLDRGRGRQPVVNMHGNRELITDVLKGKMHFDGFVISDCEGIDQITGGAMAERNALQITGVNAGIDMIMEPNELPGLRDQADPTEVKAGACR